MAIERVLDPATKESKTQLPASSRKLTVFELIALDPDEEQRLLDEDIDKVLSEGYEILEVTDLYESTEVEE